MKYYCDSSILPGSLNIGPEHVPGPKRKPDGLPVASFFRGKLAVKLRGFFNHQARFAVWNPGKTP